MVITFSLKIGYQIIRSTSFFRSLALFPRDLFLFLSIISIRFVFSLSLSLSIILFIPCDLFLFISIISLSLTITFHMYIRSQSTCHLPLFKGSCYRRFKESVASTIDPSTSSDTSVFVSQPALSPK